MVIVTVGRLDNNKKVNVAEGASIKDALVEGGYTLADNEKIQNPNGNVFSGSERVEPSGEYYILQSVKSGF